MVNLVKAVIIGAISQVLFYNFSKDVIVESSYDKIVYLALSSFVIQMTIGLLDSRSNMIRLFVEAIAVGILTLIIGKLTAIIVNSVFISQGLSTEYINEATLVVTGIFIHLFCEFVGINSWYVKNGVAAIS